MFLSGIIFIEEGSNLGIGFIILALIVSGGIAVISPEFANRYSSERRRPCDEKGYRATLIEGKIILFIAGILVLWVIISMLARGWDLRSFEKRFETESIKWVSIECMGDAQETLIEEDAIINSLMDINISSRKHKDGAWGGGYMGDIVIRFENGAQYVGEFKDTEIVFDMGRYEYYFQWPELKDILRR